MWLLWYSLSFARINAGVGSSGRQRQQDISSSVSSSNGVLII